MSLSVEVVEPVLVARGYGEKNRTKKKVAYQRGSSYPLYLNLQSKNGTTVLVAHPQSGVEAVQGAGVHVGSGYFHSSNMGLFPKHMHTGATPIPFGLGLTFDSEVALTRCLDFLEGVQPASLSVSDSPSGSGASAALAQDAALPPGQDVQTQSTRRVGHNSFREALVQYWGGVCAITGVANTGLLRASHIKPWAASTPEEQTNPFNGLLLAPQWDAAFDRGLITLDAVGQVLVSPQLAAADAALLGIGVGMRLRKPLQPQHQGFMEYHRQHVFQAA